jgi:hypothetical protein
MITRMSTVRDEKGMALPLALLSLVTLGGLLVAFLTMGSHEVLIAQNHDSSSRAFYVTDAGIEHAVGIFSSTDIPAVIAAGGNLLPAQAFGSGSYSVTVSLNPDGTYLLTSTGTYKNASRKIKAVVSLGSLPPQLAAAEVFLGPGGTYEEHGDPGGSFDGRDWTAPANIGACTDTVSCGTLTAGTPKYGAFANSSSGSFELSGGGAMYGTGCTAGACATDAALASHKVDNLVPLDRWDSFIDQTKPKATQTLTGAALTATTSYTWGTPAAPTVTVINNSSTVSWKANVSGAGVLIIDSPGPTQNLVFAAGGFLNWQGLVIIRSPGEVQFESSKSGAIKVFGSVVNRAAGRAEIEMNQNKQFIKYSSVSMAMVQRMLFSVKSWQEVSN